MKKRAPKNVPHVPNVPKPLQIIQKFRGDVVRDVLLNVPNVPQCPTG